MLNKFLSKLTLVVMIFLLAACASQPALSDRFKDKTADQIFQEAETNMAKGYYSEAIDLFEVYDSRYPFGEHIESVQLDIIYCYYQKGDMGSTLAAAERFIHLHPTSKNVDYAYYMQGLANFITNVRSIDKYLPVDFATRDLTSPKKSFLTFAELVRNFPNSRYAPDSIQRMIYLRNMFAKHEYEVGLFYYKHKAYVAAANRANQVVRHYQGAPIMPDALVLMVKSYDKLHLTNLSADATHILQTNYSSPPDIGV